MNFFIDADISPRIARILAAYRDGLHTIIHITEHPHFIHNNKQYVQDAPRGDDPSGKEGQRRSSLG